MAFMLDEWIKSGRRNSWIAANPLEAYFQKGPYVVGSKVYRATVRLGNVAIKSEYIGCGYFSGVLHWLETLKGKTILDVIDPKEIPIEAAVIENVVGDRLMRILESRAYEGWIRYGTDNGTKHFYIEF
jgi:hypothetical protein